MFSRAYQRKKRQVQMVEWIQSENLVDYETALQFMEQRANEIAAGKADECIWLL